MGKLRVLCVAAALARARAVGLGVVQNLVFAALSDWGGQAESPFTTPGQLASAAALGRVADTERPKFVVSAGGNFLPQGLPGATPRRAARAAPPCAGERRSAGQERFVGRRRRARRRARSPQRLGARPSGPGLTRRTAARSWRAVAEQPDAFRGHL
jgi:hypothetical protein